MNYQMTIEELQQVQTEIDEAYKAEIRYELNLNLRRHVIEWAHKSPGNFFVAAYSAVNGAWDDVLKDIRRGRITVNQAIEILDKMLECRLITQRVYNWHKQKFEAA